MHLVENRFIFITFTLANLLCRHSNFLGHEKSNKQSLANRFEGLSLIKVFISFIQLDANTLKFLTKKGKNLVKAMKDVCLVFSLLFSLKFYQLRHNLIGQTDFNIKPKVEFICLGRNYLDALYAFLFLLFKTVLYIMVCS